MIAEEMRRVSKDRLGAPLVFWTTLARWATEVEALEAKAKELDRVKAALIEAGTTPIEGSAELAVGALARELMLWKRRAEMARRWHDDEYPEERSFQITQTLATTGTREAAILRAAEEVARWSRRRKELTERDGSVFVEASSEFWSWLHELEQLAAVRGEVKDGLSLKVSRRRTPH